MQLYVKPALTRLTKDKGSNRLSGKVVGVTREADFLEYHVAVGEQMIKVPHNLSDSWNPAIQENVYIEVPPAARTLAENRSRFR